ncbi:MAG TPA: ABC transporter permease subunit, partial [Thermoanaerobaculia bacterium]
MNALLICAREELTLSLRSRWTQIFAIVFALLALFVAWSGYILSGGYGAQDFARTSASLIQLVILVVPLASLVIGVLSIATERGAAEILFSQPVARRTILFGQMLGIFAALAAAEAIGFGFAGIVIFSNAGHGGIGRYLIVVAGSILLTAVFVALAAAIGAASFGRRRARALAVALVVWFAAIVLFDLGALGVASFLKSGHATRV